MKRAGSGVPSAGQADIDRNHTTDPDDRTEDVHGEGDGGHEQAPVLGTSGKMVMQNS